MRRSLALAGLLLGCHRPTPPSPHSIDAGTLLVDASVVDAAPGVDAAPAPPVRDAAACTPLRVLAVHTSVTFIFGATAFEGPLRAHGKTKSYTATHPALELRDKGATKTTKHYLPACNGVPETGGVPCLDFDACEEPTVADGAGLAEPPLLACRGKKPSLYRWTELGDDVVVLEAHPGDSAWSTLLTLHPEGGCVARAPGVVRVERSLGLDE